MSATAFNASKFAEALKAKGFNSQVNPEPKPRKAYAMGLRDHQNGKPARYPSNTDYMDGYNSFEPLLVTRRVQGRRPLYSLCDVDYHDFPEWHTSIQDALYFGNIDKKHYKIKSILIAAYKDMSFDAQVARDSALKPDVKRLYQANFDGLLSTSIDNGLNWFNGGIMDYPAMPTIREFQSRYYPRVVGKAFGKTEYGYVTRKARIEDLRKGILKLKPPKPEPPKFDKHHWIESPSQWWEHHLKQSYQAFQKLTSLRCPNGIYQPINTDESLKLEQLAQCYWNFEDSKETEHENHAWDEYSNLERYYYLKEWRCQCYQNKVTEYEKSVKKYQQAIEKWQSL